MATTSRLPTAIRGLLGAAIGLAATVAILWAGLGILRDEDGPERLVLGFYTLIGATGAAEAIRSYGLHPMGAKTVTAAVAIFVGVGGVWALFTAANLLTDRLGPRFERLVRPWVFTGPALALVAFYLLFPTLRTILISATEDGGLVANYAFVFTDRDMLIALRNNALWLIFGTSGSVLIGLGFATLVDRVRREAIAKTFIFLPLSISMVGAAVIWRFVYYWRPPGEEQIGLLNGLLAGLGYEPVAFFQSVPLNTFALIAIMVWLQTGFAMVVLSAAIKAVPQTLLEAARIDGAGELQIFRSVIIPSIRGSLITVGTTIFIAILKVFDIVFVTTGGKFQTDVVANRMFKEMIRFRNDGRASALAVILLVAVIPIMVVNVRNLRRQGVGS